MLISTLVSHWHCVISKQDTPDKVCVLHITSGVIFALVLIINCICDLQKSGSSQVAWHVRPSIPPLLCDCGLHAACMVYIVGHAKHPLIRSITALIPDCIDIQSLITLDEQLQYSTVSLL